MSYPPTTGSSALDIARWRPGGDTSGPCMLEA